MAWTVNFGYGATGLTVVGFPSRRAARDYVRRHKPQMLVSGYGERLRRVKIRRA